MRWLPSLGVGLVTALVTAFASAFAADLGTRWHKVSNMEGGRGMFIAFIFLPLGFLVGMTVGTWIARSQPVASFAAGLVRLGIALGVSMGLVAASLGMAWLTADHVPTIDGRNLVLDVEVRLPPGYPVRDSLEAREFRVGLVVSSRDRAFIDLDLKGVRRSESFVIVPGRGQLVSTGLRNISASYGTFEEQVSSQFVPIPLSPKPSHKDMEWSEWFTMNRYMNLTEVPESQRAQVRYRVQFADSTG